MFLDFVMFESVAEIGLVFYGVICVISLIKASEIKRCLQPVFGPVLVTCAFCLALFDTGVHSGFSQGLPRWEVVGMKRQDVGDEATAQMITGCAPS